MKKIIQLSVITFIVFIFMNETVMAKTNITLLFRETFGFLSYTSFLVVIAVLIILYYTVYHKDKCKLRTELRNRILLLIIFFPIVLSAAGHLHYDTGTISFSYQWILDTDIITGMKITGSLIFTAVLVFLMYFNERRYFAENIKEGVLLNKKLSTRISSFSIAVIIYLSIDLFRGYLNISHSLISVISIAILGTFIASILTKILIYFYITKMERKLGSPIMSIKAT